MTMNLLAAILLSPEAREDLAALGRCPAALSLTAETMQRALRSFAAERPEDAPRWLAVAEAHRRAIAGIATDPDRN